MINGAAKDTKSVTTPEQWAGTMSGPPALCSATSSWTGALIRRWHGTSGLIEQPRLGHHYVTLHLGGPKHIRRSGEGRVATADIDAGALSLTPAGTAFSWATTGPIDFAHLYLEPRAIGRVVREDFDRDPQAIELPAVLGGDSPLLCALLLAMLGEVETPCFAPHLLLDTLLHAFIVQLVSERSSVALAQRSAPHSLAPKRLRRVLDFIEAHIESSIDLDDLAKVAGSSRFHFSRAFHDATGFPPYRYLVHRRIETAKRLLLQDTFSVPEIARQCGFNSAAQLSAMFKQVFGTSPTKFRREH